MNCKKVFTFKNPQIEEELFDAEQIKYVTWTYYKERSVSMKC